MNNRYLDSGDALNVGYVFPSMFKSVKREQLIQYSEASGDNNPLHLNDDFAKTTQFGGVIAHGMLTLAFVSELLVRIFGADWLRSGCLKVRFKGAAYLGDTLVVSGKVDQLESVYEDLNLVCSVKVCKSGQDIEILNGTARLTMRG